MKDAKEEAVQDLLAISRYAGMREDLVQAGGGNSSVKISEHEMLIKASGFQLAELTETSGWSVVENASIVSFLQGLAAVSGQEAERVGKAALEEALREGARPSIETFLHATTARVTLHTHPLLVNVLASRKGGMDELGDLFPEALCVGYATPGLELAQLVLQAQKAEGREQPSLIFLQNHGMIVSGATAREVMDATEAVLAKLAEWLHQEKQHTPYVAATRIYERLTQEGILMPGFVVYRLEDPSIAAACQKFGAELWPYATCPDCVVYGGQAPLVLSEHVTSEALQAFVKAHGTPTLISYGGEVYAAAESVRKAREIESVLSFSARVALMNQGRDLDDREFSWTEIFRLPHRGTRTKERGMTCKRQNNPNYPS